MENFFKPPSQVEIEERQAYRRALREKLSQEKLANCKNHNLQIGIVVAYGVMIIGCPSCGYRQPTDACPGIEDSAVIYPRSMRCVSMETKHYEYALDRYHPRTKFVFEAHV